jgi:transposase-like protein
MESPKTLQEAILHFSNEDTCIAYMKAMRWPDGVVVCPTCERNDVSWLANQKKWQCKSKHTQRQFSAKTGTIFEDSPLGLDKWLMAAWMISNCKNGVSSYEIAKAIGVTQKSAWFMLHRLRVAMKEEHKHTFGGHWQNPIEVDESYIGGKAKNKHLGKRQQVERKTSSWGCSTVRPAKFAPRSFRKRGAKFFKVKSSSMLGSTLTSSPTDIRVMTVWTS